MPTTLQQIDATVQVEEFVTQTNRTILQSIVKRGLIPLHKSNEKKPIFGSAECHNFVCVNYIDLRKRSYADQKPESSTSYLNRAKHVLRVAVWEEYTGVAGVCLERKFPFTFFEDNIFLQKQLEARLYSSILFVLKPPTRKMRTLTSVPSTVAANKKCTPTVSYSIMDAAAQCQNNLLISGPDTKSEEIIEMKTPLGFSKQDILAILVPEQLHDLATEIFAESGITLISVNNTIATLKKLPEITEKLFKQTLKTECTVQFPDFATCLLEKIVPKYNTFSLHVVRLTSTFDIEAKPVINLSQRENELCAAGASIIQRDAVNNTGWMLYDRNRGLEPDNMQSIVKYFSSAEIYKPKVNPVFATDESIYVTRSKLTPAMNSREFLIGAYALNIKLLKMNGLIIIGIPQSLPKEKLIETILALGKKRLAAGAQILTWWNNVKYVQKKPDDNIMSSSAAAPKSADQTNDQGKIRLGV